jgi:4a-hydroxytetrahydrobiopterin dehydratase
VTDAPNFIPELLSWEIVELDGIKRLRRVFSVDDFCQALEFTKQVGELAEEGGITPLLRPLSALAPTDSQLGRDRE